MKKWQSDFDPNVLVVAAKRSVESIRLAVDQNFYRWVVLVRQTELGDLFYYALQPEEIPITNWDWSAVEALNLHEWSSSSIVRNGRLIGGSGGSIGPASERLVGLDHFGNIFGAASLRGTRFASPDALLRSPIRHRQIIGGNSPFSTESTPPSAERGLRGIRTSSTFSDGGGEADDGRQIVFRGGNFDVSDLNFSDARAEAADSTGETSATE